MSRLSQTLNEISPKKWDSDSGTHFLSKIKFWRKRLKFDSWFLLTFFVIAVLGLWISKFIIMGIDYYISTTIYLTDLILIVTSIYALYMGKQIPKSFERLIENNENILKNPHEYKGIVKKTFNSKIEFYIPLILAIAYAGTGFAIGPLSVIMNRTLTIGTEIKIITDEILIVYILGEILMVTWYFLFGLVVLSALVILINAFRSLNQLGEKNLKITYEDLKAGGFEEIGQFVISISIPTIVLSTFFSILGFYMVVGANQLLVGYAEIAISFVITIILSFLLYKNTTDIHDAITIFKDKLKYALLTQIQEITDVIPDIPEGKIDIEIMKPILLYNKLKYKTIQSIHEYYDKIDAINDWPFNPTSVKKLVITLGSSLIPLLLTFVGFG